MGIYVTGPDGAAFVPVIIAGDGRPRTITAISSRPPYTAFSQPGDYVLTFEGVRSELRITIPFRILAGPPTGKDETLLPENRTALPSRWSARAPRSTPSAPGASIR